MRLRFRILSFIFCMSLWVVFFTRCTFAGPKWEIDEDSWIQFSLLGQVHFSYMDASDNEEDFYLRRGRLIFSGQLTDGVKFFLETDNDNAGKNGTSNVSTDIQDAFIDLQIFDYTHWVKAGLILLPFSFENRSSAASLLGIDYNSETIKFTNTFVWRDYGAEFHGAVGEKLVYTVGIFDGYDTTSGSKYSKAGLRFTGHLGYSFLGEIETGWFYTQDPTSGKEYVVAGIGFDRQNNATEQSATGSIQDSDAFVLDLKCRKKLGNNFLTINSAVYRWDNSVFDGNTAFVELGYKIGKIMPTLKYSLQSPEPADNIDDITLGGVYYMKKHNVRFGLEYRVGDSSDWLLAGIQFLM